MEKYSIVIELQEEGLGRIADQPAWEHLRGRIGYALRSAKVTPGIELVSRETFEGLEKLMAELPEQARRVGHLFMHSAFVWDEGEEHLLVPAALLEYAGIRQQAVLLAGEDLVALCSPETAEKY